MHDFFKKSNDMINNSEFLDLPHSITSLNLSGQTQETARIEEIVPAEAEVTTLIDVETIATVDVETVAARPVTEPDGQPVPVPVLSIYRDTLFNPTFVAGVNPRNIYFSNIERSSTESSGTMSVASQESIPIAEDVDRIALASMLSDIATGDYRI